MAEETKISWTDSTWNPWIGCTHAGPGCDFCYAERDDARRHWTPEGFGLGKPRRLTGRMNWQKPYQWNARPSMLIGGKAQFRKPRVFALSLGDFFDKEVETQWRLDAWQVVAETKGLEWLIVTKRIPNVEKMLPPNWCESEFKHMVLIVTVCNQAEVDRDVPRLIAFKMKHPWLRIGLSVEPMLGAIVLEKAWLQWLDWVICGGESGPSARFFDRAWAFRLMDQCVSKGVPFHFKQIGNNHAGWVGITGKGDKPEEWPRELRIRQFPGYLPRALA